MHGILFGSHKLSTGTIIGFHKRLKITSINFHKRSFLKEFSPMGSLSKQI